MPLVQATLQTEVLNLTSDPTSFPATYDAAATTWAGIATTYFAAAVNPPLAVGQAAGEAAFISTLLPVLAVFSGTPQTLGDAFAAYAVAAAAVAVASVPGSAVVPPVGSPVVALAPFTTDPVTPATTIATQVHTWALTGTWTPNAVATPPLPWS